MSRTVLANVGGFTPVIDALARDHGIIRAAVFGRIWRYCQLEDGVCRASLETIATDLGIDKATVMRHAAALVADDYLQDLSPDLRNRPHIYKDTGKAGLTISISASVAESNASNKTVAQRNATVAECNTGVAESKLSIVKETYQETTRTADDVADTSEYNTILALYEANFGMATPIIAEDLRLAAATYPAGWAAEAMRRAVANGVRKWPYVTAILKNWQANGFGSLPPRSNGAGHLSQVSGGAMKQNDDGSYN